VHEQLRKAIAVLRYLPRRGMTKDPRMQRLIDGVHRFRTESFGGYRALFQRLSREGQDPHTLFITCSDSRVLAELVTHSQPGDLFVVKNVGNIVPPVTAHDASSSTGAAIEFAVEVLRVQDVVVCGHSQCGAMSALMGGVPPTSPPHHLARWLEHAAPVRQTVQTEYAHLKTDVARQRAAEEENVLFGLENLTTYPGIQRRLAAGDLRLHGWFYHLATGELHAYAPETRQFQLLLPDAGA
jgi:carbonic anhydrase